MNKAILKGRLTADVDFKSTQSGVSVCDFSIAVNRRFDKKTTDFINIQAWRQTAEFISKYFSKGQEILVIGELHIDKYEKDGKTNYITRVVADEVDFCGKKSENSNSSSNNSDDDIDDEDLPF